MTKTIQSFYAFSGWARMAHPLQAFSVVEVAKPKIGENHPARVRADVTVNLNLRPEIKAEWENLRKHDVAFLITVRPINPIGSYRRVSLISSLIYKSLCLNPELLNK